MKVEMNLTGLDGVMETLRGLPPELASKRGGPVRAALRKGALVIHRQAVANLQAVTANATTTGERESTGLLKANVVVTRGKEPRGTKGERYLVRVRRKAYPNRAGKTVTTLAAGQLLEYGSSKQPAEPWLRPAFEGRAREAINTVERELAAAVDRIVQKLARQNRGK